MPGASKQREGIISGSDTAIELCAREEKRTSLQRREMHRIEAPEYSC